MPPPSIRLARYEIRVGHIGAAPGIALVAVENHPELPAGLLAVWAVATPAKPLRWSTAEPFVDNNGNEQLKGLAGVQALRAVPLSEHDAAPDLDLARALARTLPALRAADDVRSLAYAQLPAALALHYPDAAVTIDGDCLEVMSASALPARAPDGDAPAGAGRRRAPALSRRGSNHVWV